MYIRMQLFCAFGSFFFLLVNYLLFLNSVRYTFKKNPNKQKGELHETCTSHYDPEVINGEVSVTLISLLPVFFSP